MPTSTPDAVTLSFTISGLPPSPNRTKGLHWTKLEKIKKEWVELVQAAAMVVKHQEHLKGLYDHCQIEFEIMVGDNRRHDPDNLMWSVTKPTLDALQGILLKDDTIDHVTLSYKFSRQAPAGFRVTLTGK